MSIDQANVTISPTVFASAIARISSINDQIGRLKAERNALYRRLRDPRHVHMLESERRTPLPCTATRNDA